jgi:hypothetical protein
VALHRRRHRRRGDLRRAARFDAAPARRPDEGEAALNDPVAILLVIGFGTWITTESYNLVDMLERSRSCSRRSP